MPSSPSFATASPRKVPRDVSQQMGSMHRYGDTLMKASFLSAPLVAAVALGCAGIVHAQAVPTLFVGSYGGSSEALFKEKVIPAFEAAYKVKIVYVAGNSTDTLAKLQSQKVKQELDLVIMDDGLDRVLIGQN